MDRARRESVRSEPPYRLLFLGRWHPNKGVDLLMEVLGNLPASDWERVERVVVAGGGPLEVDVRDAVRKLQKEARPVELRGYLTRDEAQEAMLASDYLLIPSRIESIPIVFSDAMKLSLPVVASPVGDFPILLSGPSKCGVLASAADIDGLLRALHEALQSSPARFLNGSAEMAARFEVSASAKSVLAGILDDAHDD